MENPLQKKERVFGLDLVRAIAILFVLIAHSSVFLEPLGVPFGIFTFGGQFGVELFFVLSGYLIAGILIRESEAQRRVSLGAIWHFWLRRWWRTLPAYYSSLLFHLFVFAILFRQATHFDWRYLLFLQNLSSPMPGFFPQSWSLTIEELFYLSFPLTLYCFNRVGCSVRSSLAAGSLLYISLSLLLRFFFIDSDVLDWDWMVRKVVLYRGDAIIYGVLAAYLAHYYPRIWRAVPSILCALGTCLIFLVCVMMRDLRAPALMQTGYALYFSVVGITCTCFLPIADRFKRFEKTSAARKRFHSFVTQLSLLSYSLYLSHFIFTHLCHERLDLDNPKIAFASFLLYLSGSYFLAWLQYRYVEIPGLKLRERFAPVKKKQESR